MNAEHRTAHEICKALNNYMKLARHNIIHFRNKSVSKLNEYKHEFINQYFPFNNTRERRGMTLSKIGLFHIHEFALKIFNVEGLYTHTFEHH